MVPTPIAYFYEPLWACSVGPPVGSLQWASFSLAGGPWVVSSTLTYAPSIVGYSSGLEQSLQVEGEGTQTSKVTSHHLFDQAILLALKITHVPTRSDGELLV